MAHGLNSVVKRGDGKTGIGSRRIFPPHFKLQVLDSYRNDADCKGNQRATARKYGIHRRQIQKWLQAENNLRNSVGKGKTSGECGSPEARKCGIELALRSVDSRRQRDDSSPDAFARSASCADARVPDAYSESAPLDFTTHSRSLCSSPPPDPAAPIDLSLKRPAPAPLGDFGAPIYLPPTSPHVPSPVTIVQPDVWDLSTKTYKRKLDEPLHSPTSSVSSQNGPKHVKLFKPYLDDLHDNSNGSDEPLPQPPPCCVAPLAHPFETQYYQNNNNNNNICDIKNEYTLHELQPTKYFYPLYSISDCCDSMYCTYEDVALLQGTPLKQRQSYSLDFKLSAIECYYQDEMCRGNQRAVASKYNIHRRQVQKWLKQEEELRQRNEHVKHMHAVR